MPACYFRRLGPLGPAQQGPGFDTCNNKLDKAAGVRWNVPLGLAMPILREIAAAVGLSKMTVSRALRGLSGVAPETRERVLRKAQEMGYQRDPVVVAFLRGRGGVVRARGMRVAYVSFHGTRMGAFPVLMSYWEGVGSSLASLGYEAHLEDFDGRLSPGRFVQVMRARGYSGLIIGPHPVPGVRLEGWDFSSFPVVLMGDSVAWPKLPRVTQSFLQHTYQALETIWERGYRRMALCLPPGGDLRAAHGWTGAFLSFHHGKRLDASSLIRVHSYDDGDVEGFHRWVGSLQAEVVLSATTMELRWLRQSGWVIPRDLAFFCLDLTDPRSTVSGVRPDALAMGEIAGSQLAHQIEHGLRGVPERAVRTVVTGRFSDGRTLPPKQAPASESMGTRSQVD